MPTTAVLADLSPREAEILAGIRRGETNVQIAARLFVSPKTVERHVSNLFVKLGVRSRAEAASVAAAARTEHSRD
jgi:DNA-binding NarL/FixJ family response regulator